MLTGIDAGDRAGASLAIGPFDGDSKMDLIIGAPNSAGLNNSQPNAGEVYVVWGSTALVSRSLSAANLVINGVASGYHTGAALTMGDIDWNPPSDFAMLASGSSAGRGDVFILLGRARTSFPAQWNLAGGWDRDVVSNSSTGPFSRFSSTTIPGKGRKTSSLASLRPVRASSISRSHRSPKR